MLDTPPPYRASPPVLYHSNTKAKFLTLVGAGSSHKGRTISSSDWRISATISPAISWSASNCAVLRWAYATLLDVHGFLARGDKKGPQKRSCRFEIWGPGWKRSQPKPFAMTAPSMPKPVSMAVPSPMPICHLTCHEMRMVAAWPPHCLRGPSLPLSAPGPQSGQTLAFLLSRQGARTGAVLGPSRHKKGTAACVEMHTSTIFQSVNRKVCPNPQQCGRFLRTIFARRKGSANPREKSRREAEKCAFGSTQVWIGKFFRLCPCRRNG